MDYAIRAFKDTDVAWLVDQHATYYARAEGFDETFGPLVSDIVSAFIHEHDPCYEAGWMAHKGATPLGTVFCVRLNEATAKLRLFYVVPKARGTGLAQALLSRCLEFAKSAGYKDMTLWTHESHRAAGAIYRRNGFDRVAAKPVHSFGVDLVEETWRIQF